MITLGGLITVVVIVLFAVLLIWAVKFLGAGTIPDTPMRCIIVLIVLLTVIAIVSTLTGHSLIRL